MKENHGEPGPRGFGGKDASLSEGGMGPNKCEGLDEGAGWQEAWYLPEPERRGRPGALYEPGQGKEAAL